ncbi:MAG: hypothetical protein PHV30_03145 [Candidatus Margulisbacteria bacterium]|nr:hypothetical protein [Candidatus Margulisiibacteriota bacterium]
MKCKIVSNYTGKTVKDINELLTYLEVKLLIIPSIINDILNKFFNYKKVATEADYFNKVIAFIKIISYQIIIDDTKSNAIKSITNCLTNLNEQNFETVKGKLIRDLRILELIKANEQLPENNHFNLEERKAIAKQRIAKHEDNYMMKFTKDHLIGKGVFKKDDLIGNDILEIFAVFFEKMKPTPLIDVFNIFLDIAQKADRDNIIQSARKIMAEEGFYNVRHEEGVPQCVFELLQVLADQHHSESSFSACINGFKSAYDAYCRLLFG